MFITNYTCLPLKLHQLPMLYTIKLEETERSKNKNIGMVGIQCKLLLQNLATEPTKDVNTSQEPALTCNSNWALLMLLPYHTDLQYSITWIAIQEVQNTIDRHVYSLNISTACSIVSPNGTQVFTCKGTSFWIEFSRSSIGGFPVTSDRTIEHTQHFMWVPYLRIEKCYHIYITNSIFGALTHVPRHRIKIGAA
jgi:hypothetical protein